MCPVLLLRMGFLDQECSSVNMHSLPFACVATRSNATAQAITQFHIAHNDFEGDLSMITNSHLTTVTVHQNPKLCGMVPASVRYAKGYDPAGTGLGKPCPA